MYTIVLKYLKIYIFYFFGIELHERRFYLLNYGTDGIGKQMKHFYKEFYNELPNIYNISKVLLDFVISSI